MEFATGLIDLGAAFVENPKETLYYTFLEPIYTDWQAGNYGEAIGGSLFVAVEVVVGAKGVASGTRAATAAIRGSRAAQATGRAARATSNFLDDLARTPIDEAVRRNPESPTCLHGLRTRSSRSRRSPILSWRSTWRTCTQELTIRPGWGPGRPPMQ
jgi:hypothetical protein